MKAVEQNDPWETGELGRDEQHVRVASAETEAAVDEYPALQLISVRMPKDLLRQLKFMAEYRGIGYQPMMRDILSRWAGHEIMAIAEEMRARETI